jgi:hypothetical protein
VTLALGIAAFCLVVLFGLLPLGLNSSQSSIQQTAAASMAKAIISDLRATPSATPPITSSTSAIFGIPIPASGQGNARHTLFLRADGTTGGALVDTNASAAANPLCRATLYFYPPATAQRTATSVRILITWPAMADQNAGVDPIDFGGSYEAVTELARN